MMLQTDNIHPVLAISFIEPNQAYLIEASAGTGKTWTIERLFIKALLERQELNLEQILLVTFTKAATNELKARILQQLQQTVNWLIELKYNSKFSVEDIFFKGFLAKRQYNLIKDIQLLIRVMQNFDQASIYTIHGFCHKVLQDYQVECNTMAGFELVSNQKELILTMVRDFFRKHIVNNSLFKGQIEIVYQTLKQVLDSNPESDIVDKLAAKIPNDLMQLQNGGYTCCYTVKTNPDLGVLICTPGEKVDKIAILYELLSSIVNYISQHYVLYKQLSNALSYDELIAIVADRLKHNFDLCRQLNNAYNIAFIDEFQDTDALQWQIFSQIYSLTKGSCSGIVVVVGDPKQAIYQFRGADIDVYLEARQLIKNKLQLTENRRSHPQIVNFVNQLFAVQNNPGCFGMGIDYLPVQAKVDHAALLQLPTLPLIRLELDKLLINKPAYDQEVQLVGIGGASAALREQNLLRAITFEILALLKTDAALVNRIAILVTKNIQAHKLVDYFSHYGIKACELKLGSIYATTTAQELYSILAAILDLSNRQLLIKALTARLFNLPLVQLSWFNLTDTDKLIEADINKIELIQRSFFNYQQIWQQSGIISLIYQLISDSTLFNEQNHSLTNRELSNFLQLGELLNKHTAQNHLETLYYLAAKIADAASLDADMNGGSEELVRLDNDDQQIIITTQHKAKGLEYDILFCPYFKADSAVNNLYDPSYRLPFFARYRDGNKQIRHELVIDKTLAQRIVDKHNSEVHRLNYVALTRAKARLYLYLKAPSITKYGKYNLNARPDKLVELFGYQKNNSQADLHNLFHYPSFFTNGQALKNPDILPGVVCYINNNLTDNDLNKLHFDAKPEIAAVNQLDTIYFKADHVLRQTINRQSYSLLTAPGHKFLKSRQELAAAEHFSENGSVVYSEINYSLSILNNLSGAKFGTLVHDLCEHYPLKLSQIEDTLNQNNIAVELSHEFFTMIEQIFNYPILPDGIKLASLTHKLPELGFNLAVNSLSLSSQFVALLSQHYGNDHPYVLACSSLGQINSGFLNGFIDIFFEHNGKYYILDYKTNSLNDYTSTTNPHDMDNSLVNANASNHYYLQYLLYLVAVKRHLQRCFKIDDATHLLGGAVYYYVRGLFVVGSDPGGVYVDEQCQSLIRELDILLLRVIY